MIFETENLIVRKLVLEDLSGFHKMQRNMNVMKFVDGNVKTFKEHKKELKSLIDKYNLPNNNFWIYAVVTKKDPKFIGTVALIKESLENEIGYRFLEKYWNLGFGSEICKGLLLYCKQINLKKIVAYVVDKNKASVKILEKNNFILVDKFINEDKDQESKYIFNL
ncbi:GNAT family N-acetyltransferase [Polaribacter sargassicola]|uniref:GNAT family N-acetyltransferase n=1 Tax=Polaribacter sargassicola TaxID=2836891 RepID=UPI001F28C5CF|nr:GNAT family N-acetyltransferase [Polaribacter sp. DS7-9]MCG1036918.1 GNAT family N-acetyltransferase [Polaribacter sp. DS7-9]